MSLNKLEYISGGFEQSVLWLVQFGEGPAEVLGSWYGVLALYIARWLARGVSRSAGTKMLRTMLRNLHRRCGHTTSGLQKVSGVRSRPRNVRTRLTAPALPHDYNSPDPMPLPRNPPHTPLLKTHVPVRLLSPLSICHLRNLDRASTPIASATVNI